MKKRDSNNQPDNLGFSKRLSNQTGAAMIEYGLLASLLALSLIVAMNFVRGGVEEEFGELNAALGEGE